MAQVIGARIGLTTYTAGTDPRPGRAEHNAERTLLENNVVIGSQGIEANRPTAGKGKALYWNDDRKALQWDLGAGGWTDVSTNGGGGAGRQVLVAGTATEGTSERSARADHTHNLPLATATVHGAMSASDKAKLNAAVSAATAGALIIRDANGRAQVAAPAVAADIANKNYVDSVVGGAAAPVVNSETNGLATPAMLAATTRVDAASSTALADTLMVRDVGGRVQVATPANVSDAAPKSYVDGQISSHRHDGTHITTGTIAAARLPLVTTAAHGAMLNTDKSKLDQATDASNANTLVMRSAAGTFQCATPSLAAEVANKTYVDGQIGTRAPSSHTHDGSAINTGTIATARLPYASATSAGIIDSATLALINSHNHDASAISTGTLAAARLPVATPSINGAMSSADKTRLDGSTPAATANALVLRDSAGRAQFGYPAVLADAASADYVEDRIATRASSSHSHDTSSITSGTMSTARLPYAGGSAAGIIGSSTYNYIYGHAHDGSDITSGIIPHARIQGALGAYELTSSVNPGYTVYVDKTGRFFRSTSAQRYKADITPWAPDPRNLLHPQASIYRRVLEDGTLSDYLEVGVIAEQAGERVPEFVQYGPDSPEDTEDRIQGWDYHHWTTAHQVLHQWTAARDDHQDRELARILAHLGLTPLAEGE